MKGKNKNHHIEPTVIKNRLGRISDNAIIYDTDDKAHVCVQAAAPKEIKATIQDVRLCMKLF